MAGNFLLAVLAAFGAVSVLWALFGGLLPSVKRGWLLYPGDGLAFAYLYLWLRWIGLVRCPLVVADLGLSQEDRRWLEERGIQVWSCERLMQRIPELLEGRPDRKEPASRQDMEKGIHEV